MSSGNNSSKVIIKKDVQSSVWRLPRDTVCGIMMTGGSLSFLLRRWRRRIINKNNKDEMLLQIGLAVSFSFEARS